MRRLFVMAILWGLVVSQLLGAQTKSLTLVLKWNPNEKQTIPVLDITGGIHAISMAPVVDKREKGLQIGENTEKKIVVPVSTTSNIAGYVGDHVATQLKAIGLDVRRGDIGDRVLKSDLIAFWVAEGQRYRV